MRCTIRVSPSQTCGLAEDDLFVPSPYRLCNGCRETLHHSILTVGPAILRPAPRLRLADCWANSRGLEPLPANGQCKITKVALRGRYRQTSLCETSLKKQLSADATDNSLSFLLTYMRF